jgi:DNA-binding NarL/FixJ family response regulator
MDNIYLPRILIIDNKPKTEENLKPILEKRGYNVKVVSGVGDENFLKEIRKFARSFRPHIAIIDLRLSGPSELDSIQETDIEGLVLSGELTSINCKCILYSAYLSPEIDRKAKDIGIYSWFEKGGDPEVLLNLIAKARDIICTYYRDFTLHWKSGWTSEKIIQALFGTDIQIPPDIVEDILGLLFPKDIRIILENPSGAATTLKTIPNRRSVVLKAWPEGKEPVIVKLALAERVKKEEGNYSKIKNRLVGLFLASLQEPAICFWDLGGVVYSFVGSSLRNLPTFGEFYKAKKESHDILKPLNDFFNNTWSRLYRETVLPLRTSLFEDYDQTLGIQKRLYDFPNREQNINFPGLLNHFPNPILWVQQKKQESIIPDTRQAVTHGDLHGDNLFVDGEHAWAIDFERTGPGHILRDFIELEIDIVTRLINFPEDSLIQFYELVVVLVAPLTPSSSLQSTLQLRENFETNKALEIIQGIRKLAYEITRYSDFREYLWGLLFNTVFVATLVPEGSSQRERALLLGSVICSRLEYWGKEWPIKNGQ